MTQVKRFVPGVVPVSSDLERCYVPVCRGQLLCSTDLPWSPIAGAQWRFLNPQLDAQTHYLGDYDNRHCYAVDITEPSEVSQYSWEGMRVLLSALDPALYEIASRALQVVGWDADHKYCGRCGGETQPHPNERAKICSPCGAEYYPRLSPCIITLVTRDDHCLLAHNPQFPARFYSALAGFVEAGETLDSTLRREVHEEVGLSVGQVRYFDSQSWPFPSQLMIGFHAEYESGDIVVDGEEIVDAGWYRFDQLPLIPPETTLAGQLIREFTQRF